MIALRPMRAAVEDYLHMQAWFAEPELQQWVWCDEKGEPPVPLSRIAEKYGSRAANPTDVFPCFILLDGEPVGFIQYYLHTAEAIGLDMWIGVPGARNRGFGAEPLRRMVELIRRKHPGVKEVFIDPEKENLRAIRCYEKAGFKPDHACIDEEGAACLLMKNRFE